MPDLAPESRSETAAVELDREEVIAALQTRERFLAGRSSAAWRASSPSTGSGAAPSPTKAAVALAGVSARSSSAGT